MWPFDKPKPKAIMTGKELTRFVESLPVTRSKEYKHMHALVIDMQQQMRKIIDGNATELVNNYSKVMGVSPYAVVPHMLQEIGMNAIEAMNSGLNGCGCSNPNCPARTPTIPKQYHAMVYAAAVLLQEDLAKFFTKFANKYYPGKSPAQIQQIMDEQLQEAASRALNAVNTAKAKT